MAAYSVKVRQYGRNDMTSVIIDYDRFEKVDEESFHKKVKEKIGCGFELKDVVKL